MAKSHTGVDAYVSGYKYPNIGAGILSAGLTLRRFWQCFARAGNFAEDNKQGMESRRFINRFLAKYFPSDPIVRLSLILRVFIEHKAS